MFNTLMATRVWNWTRPWVAVITSRSRNSRTASTSPAADGMSWGEEAVISSARSSSRVRSCGTGPKHVHEVPLVLAHPPADGGQLHRTDHARGVGHGLHDAHDSPLEDAEGLPPPQHF